MTTPTVVLVHGACADAAAWIGVIAELRSRGIPVLAPPNPLRGLASDAAYVARVLAATQHPLAVALSEPQQVADLIRDAVRATSRW